MTVSEDDLWSKYDGRLPEGRILVKDRISDAMFQQVLLRADEYEVIATTNLNGDYLSDALAAQVGGLGMAPGANEGDGVALFEATHGTAPKYAGLDKVNPCSVILSGVMMLDWLGWNEAGRSIENAIGRAIGQKRVDLRPGASDGRRHAAAEDVRVRTGDRRKPRLRGSTR